LIFDESQPKKSQIARRAREATPGETQELEISARGQRLRLEAELMRATLGGVESAIFGLDDPVYEQAERNEYLESIEIPDDFSADSTAERILAGITGYIYRAFRLSNPDANGDDFARFKQETLRGFEQGLEEGRGYIEAMGDLTDDLSEQISETEDLVRDGLEAFFDREEGRFSA
jgi:hypothetical protein